MRNVKLEKEVELFKEVTIYDHLKKVIRGLFIHLTLFPNFIHHLPNILWLLVLLPLSNVQVFLNQ